MHTVIDNKVGIRQIPQWQTHKKSYYDIDSSESTLEMIFSHNLVDLQVLQVVSSRLLTTQQLNRSLRCHFPNWKFVGSIPQCSKRLPPTQLPKVRSLVSKTWWRETGFLIISIRNLCTSISCSPANLAHKLRKSQQECSFILLSRCAKKQTNKYKKL